MAEGGGVVPPFKIATQAARFRVFTVQMKFSLPIFGLAWLTLFSAPAQVTVDVVLDQEQFLPTETMPVAVRITNRSGQPLHLGADADWLTFKHGIRERPGGGQKSGSAGAG